MSDRIRLGMITPSSNTVIEPTFATIAAEFREVLSIHYTRLRVTDISLAASSARQFQLDTMLDAARLLADARPSAIAWNGTSGAWRGLDDDRRFCTEVRREFGIPATTASLAQVEAFRLYGVTRFSLVVPYASELRDAIVATYANEGFACIESAFLSVSDNFEIAHIGPDAIRDAIRRSNSPESEAVAVVCTNLAAAGLIDEMERELEKPIFDSLLLALWHPLHIGGWNRPIPRWGQLLREFRTLADEL